MVVVVVVYVVLFAAELHVGSKQSRRGERRSLDHRDDDSPLPALVALTVGWRDTDTATKISQETEDLHATRKEEPTPLSSLDGLRIRIQTGYLKDW